MEPGEKAFAKLQRHPAQALSPVHQGVRMALQLSPDRPYVGKAGNMVVQVIKVTLFMSAPCFSVEQVRPK